ncbi:hypothetical protein [Candidatus Korobacter versatilis]|nr:hypothetical protein [Candidatus Koribacter versatilis]
MSQEAKATNNGNRSSETSSEHHTAPVVMTAFSHDCPSVTFTTEKEAADYILQTQVGGYVLASPKGDVLYISPAKTLKNMVKDMCKYISSARAPK